MAIDFSRLIDKSYLHTLKFKLYMNTHGFPCNYDFIGISISITLNLTAQNSINCAATTLT
ncbi:protein of unknown function [Candidatus Nitrotoga arctica]|uniref:Uncharacterized protein n=1 Tax=Candidatus Nitrotoga arctica TaxID=453162 RepID=A0ABN8AS04_9PROT|nr:protein of unknown function [Candidatus Nitrotoga arctica]